MKKLLFFIIFISFLVFFGVVSISWWLFNISPVSESKNEITFVIKKGSSAKEIGENLENLGIIKSKTAFLLYLKVKGIQNKISAGEFLLDSSKNLSQIVSSLMKGPSLMWVTIPEGLRVEQVAEKFAENIGMDSATFLKMAKDKEGYLFPETYLVPRTLTPEKAIDMMTKQFTVAYAKIDKGSACGLSKEEVVIMASLIERETKNTSERKIVAGILCNRLKAGWPLQVDASIQYILGKSKNWWAPITRANWEIKSPYNTYKNTGLPPSPICSPGKTALEATLNPAETDYWFYLHDEKGVIHYARTAEDHQANVAKYLR